jgi:hypothetical protein
MDARSLWDRVFKILLDRIVPSEKAVGCRRIKNICVQESRR